MGEVTSEKVTQFKGLLKGLNAQDSITERRGLDTPRELKNLIVNEFGHLWMPPAPNHSIADIAALGGAAGPRIKKIAHTRGGFFFHIGDVEYGDTTQGPGSIIQDANLVQEFTWGTKENPDPVTSAGPGEDNRALRFSWVNSSSDAAGTGIVLIGNELETWKLSGGSWSDVSAGNKQGPHSILYKGRRFVAGGNVNGLRTVWYSDLNQPETFGTDSWFKLEGDAGSGSNLEQYTGHIVGFAVWEDLLIILASQSIWVLSGTSPETFHLRRTSSAAGCLSIESVAEVQGGLMFFGGIPEGETGIYLFTGSESELVSKDISWFFRQWDSQFEAIAPLANQTNRNRQEDEGEWYFNSVRWQDFYIFSAPTVDGNNRQIFLYNILNKTWTTFHGWGQFPRLGLEKKYYHPYSLIIGNHDNKVWRATKGFPRPPNIGGAHEPARFKLGWYDQNHAVGLSRFLAVKVSAWKIGTGTPTIQLTADVPDGGQVVSAVENVGDDVYDTLVFPLNLRGHGLTLDFDIRPVHDDNEITIEQIELISSRKGEKVSRR